MTASGIEEERQIVECDQVQRAAQSPRFCGRSEKSVLIRRLAATEMQRVQAVAVKLCLQTAEALQHREFVLCGGKKILSAHTEQTDIVELHGRSS